MKKYLILFLWVVIPCILFGQTSQPPIDNYKIADNVGITASRGFSFKTDKSYDSWIVTVIPGTMTATNNVVKMQVSPDGTNWLDYANMPVDTLTSVTPTAFEDNHLASMRMRLYVTKGAGGTLTITAWVTLKRKE